MVEIEVKKATSCFSVIESRCKNTVCTVSRRLFPTGEYIRPLYIRKRWSGAALAGE
jgi:hypothetical protein